MTIVNGARTLDEQRAMVIITGATNLAMLPCILLLHRRNRPWEAFCGAFTCLTSTLYHTCDSLHQPIWLSAIQWHQADNIGAITSFCIWAIYLMDIQDAKIWCYSNFGAMGAVIILQIHAPWNLNYTIGPIATAFGCLACRLICFGCPKYNWLQFRRGLVLLVRELP